MFGSVKKDSKSLGSAIATWKSLGITCLVKICYESSINDVTGKGLSLLSHYYVRKGVQEY